MSPRPALPGTHPTAMESILAAIVVALCVLMLLRMALGERRRQRVDAVVLRLGSSLRRFGHADNFVAYRVSSPLDSGIRP